MNNKKNGNEFEKTTAKILSNNGFWVYRIPDKINGQPFDLIAVGNGTVLALDCKVCSNDIFDKGRIEDNQHTSMELFQRLNPDCFAGFVLKFRDESAAAVSYNVLMEYKKRCVRKEEILKIGMEFDYGYSNWFRN